MRRLDYWIVGALGRACGFLANLSFYVIVVASVVMLAILISNPTKLEFSWSADFSKSWWHRK